MGVTGSLGHDRRLRARLDRRIRSEWFNAKRSVGLVGWRRSTGPPTEAGARVRSERPHSAVPVVVCVWRRPERLEATLSSLAAQSRPIALWIWNNNPALRLLVDETVTGVSDLDVDVVHCRRNIGGFGRFYVARRLARRHRCVVFLDDDQVPAPDFIESLLDEFESKTAIGTWAFRFRGRRSYWDRVLAEPGERVKFCATRGMICDTEIFLEEGLFQCPRRFWFVEDLWLSYYADHVMGWRLFKSGASVLTEPDDQGQFNYLGATKDIMLRYLVGLGWDPVLTESGSASSARPARST